jgi:predicted ATPase
METTPEVGNLQRFTTYIHRLHEDFTLENLRRCYSILTSAQRRSLFQQIAERGQEFRDALQGTQVPRYTLAYVPLSDVIDRAADYTRAFFTRQLKYIGPLRDEPKPVYPLASAIDPDNIGFRGENTAAVLELHRNSPVTYIPSKQFSENAKTYVPRDVPLQEAVLDWLDYMGVAKGVQTTDRGKLGHELRVSVANAQPYHDLTHVGVGVSQVLPILVLSLLAEPGSTLIFEQPELHLHPRVQSRLADFFVSMTMLDLQCVVETHSEYLITRLRYRAAVDGHDHIPKNVIMYFVEKQDGQSTYRPIHINRFGVIEYWPEGFFDENEEQSAAILKAGMNRRREENKRKRG